LRYVGRVGSGNTPVPLVKQEEKRKSLWKRLFGRK
jgi:hypothetical protein